MSTGVYDIGFRLQSPTPTPYAFTGLLATVDLIIAGRWVELSVGRPAVRTSVCPERLLLGRRISTRSFLIKRVRRGSPAHTKHNSLYSSRLVGVDKAHADCLGQVVVEVSPAATWPHMVHKLY